MKRIWLCSVLVVLFSVSAEQSRAQFQNDDILIGKSVAFDTMAVLRGGAVVADPYTQPFIAAMDFDNTGGIDNNAAGNLIMIDRGTSVGSVYIGATDGSGTVTQVGGFGVGFPAFDALELAVPSTADLFEQVAVSPDNTKIAITTSASATLKGALLLFDYNPAQLGVNNSMVLTNGRAVDNAWYLFGQHEVEWMDNDTMLMMDGDSAFVDTIDLDVSGNFDLGSRTRRRELLGPLGGEQPLDSDSAPVAYNPAISPYMFLGAGDFANGVSSNYIWVLDPNATETNGDWKQVARARYDTSLNAGVGATNTIRDIALLSDGTLAIAMFGGSVYTLDVSTLDGSACGDPANFDSPDGGCGGLSDNTGTTMVIDGDIEFDTDANNVSNSQFVFMTVARTALTTPGDFDGDGDVDGRDFLEWQRGNSPTSLSAGDLADWQDNYGSGPLVATQAVPEPTSLLLAALSCGLVFVRRQCRQC